MKSTKELSEHRNMLCLVWSMIGMVVARIVFEKTTLPTGFYEFDRFAADLETRIFNHDLDKMRLAEAAERQLTSEPIFEFQYMCHDIRQDHHAAYWLVVPGSLTKSSFAEHLLDHAAVALGRLVAKKHLNKPAALFEIPFLIEAKAFTEARTTLKSGRKVSDIEALFRKNAALQHTIDSCASQYKDAVHRIAPLLEEINYECAMNGYAPLSSERRSTKTNHQTRGVTAAQ